MAEIPRLFFTREEAAQAIGLGVDTVSKAINAGTLRAKRSGRDGGGKYLISQQALHEWFDQLEDA